MVNTLQDTARSVYAWIATAVAMLENKLIDYATEVERQRLVAKLEQAQADMLDVIEELRELDDRRGRQIFHMASECKRPDVCPFYGHDRPGIGLHNKSARDEQEQAVHG